MELDSEGNLSFADGVNNTLLQLMDGNDTLVLDGQYRVSDDSGTGTDTSDWADLDVQYTGADDGAPAAGQQDYGTGQDQVEPEFMIGLADND
jgi:hypothetical protein